MNDRKLPTISLQVEKQKDWDSATVYLQMDDKFETDFGYLMVACEYLINFTAKRSKLPYEQAIQKLVEGAKGYKSISQKGNA